MVLTEREVSVHFGWLVDELGGTEVAAMKLGQSPGNISKMRNPSCGRQPSPLMIAKASALTGSYTLLDALFEVAGRHDETARLRKGLTGLQAQLDDLLKGETR